ncbi:hypothetical protein ACET3Z_021650 [Daucus carota]
MSGFFTLGGKDQEQDQASQENSLFLFKNEEIYNKGFELWQQYYQLHQQQKTQSQDVDLSLVGGSASNYSSTRRTNDNDHTFLYRSSSSSGFGLHMRQSGVLGNNNNNSNNMIGGGSSSVNCQDCGNQAKKDCVHMRCRTCCKSRGFHCQTHVKSTWVPAAKRREKQQQLQLSSSLQQPQQDHEPQEQNQLSLMRGAHQSKRTRENPLPCTRLQNHNSGLEVGQFPAEITSSAVFRCVNVRAMDDAQEQYAYQAAVNIGGHVFKGLLYDQGPESRYVGAGENSTSGGAAQQSLNLVTTATTSTNPPGVTWLDSSTTYPTPLNAFMAGTQFFPPPRP